MLKTKLISSALVLSAILFLGVGCNKNDNTLSRPERVSESEQQKANTNSESNMTDEENGEVAGETISNPTKQIKVADKTIEVELAESDAAKAQGLSDRSNLAEGKGMLFDFAKDDFKKPGFWMKNMLISIDIIWIHDGKVIGLQQNAPLPPEEGDLPVYYPPSDITHVLEVPAGWSQKNNVTIGTTVTL